MKMHPTLPGRRAHGFTLIELLASVALVASLSLLGWHGMAQWHRRAGIAVSTAQLHGLVVANTAYATDNNGDFAPAMSRDNLTRWHGGRDTVDGEFDPARGYLAAYGGGGKTILTCPLLRDFKSESFEQGAGGYGYNAQYIGGTPADPFHGANISSLPSLGRVIMFATTALAVGTGIQEYPFSEPFFWVDKRGRARGELQPSTHFRAAGKALIAWGDGSVTAEGPGVEAGPNFYGGDNKKNQVGWFGPREQNGFWNPDSPVNQQSRHR